MHTRFTYRTAWVTLLAICLATTAFGQTKATEKQYRQKPLWIQMIKDPQANYFEVQKAFRIYWQHHEPPEGESEEMEAASEGRMSRRKRQKMYEETEMVVALRNYKTWRKSVLPYVRPDGTIPGLQERLAIWEQQRNHSK